MYARICNWELAKTGVMHDEPQTSIISAYDRDHPKACQIFGTSKCMPSVLEPWKSASQAVLGLGPVPNKWVCHKNTCDFL